MKWVSVNGPIDLVIDTDFGRLDARIPCMLRRKEPSVPGRNMSACVEHFNQEPCYTAVRISASLELVGVTFRPWAFHIHQDISAAARNDAAVRY